MRLLVAYPNHLSWKAINSEDKSLWEMQPYTNTPRYVELKIRTRKGDLE